MSASQKLQHTAGGSTTRDDVTDLGAPMRPGDPKQRQGPEDALSGETRGDYAQRLGGPDARSFTGEAVEDPAPGEPRFKMIPQQTPATAREGLSRAEIALEEINRRIDAGDPDVSADDLIKAETELRIAKSRQAVAERQAAAEAERVRLARIEQIKADLAEQLDPAPLQEVRAQMSEAIERYVAVCAAQDEARTNAWGELSGLGGLLPGILLNDRGYGAISVGGRTYQQAPVQRGIAQVATEAIRKHYPRTEVRLGKPED